MLHEQMALTGYLCITWAFVEYLIAALIWEALNLKPETGRIVTGGLDILPRLNMAIKLTRHLKAPRAVVSTLVMVRKELQDGLVEQRNFLIHGAHYPGGEEGTFYELHRGKGSGEPRLITPVEIRSVCQRLDALGASLSETHSNWVRLKHSKEDARSRI